MNLCDLVPSIKALKIEQWVGCATPRPKTFRVTQILLGPVGDLHYSEPAHDDVWIATWDPRVGPDGLMKPPPRTLSQLLADSTSA